MHLLKSPLVDLTTIVGVESLYHQGANDPHSYALAGQFGNMIVYAQSVRFPLPVRNDREPDIPTLLNAIHTRNSDLLRPVEYSTETKVTLEPEFIEPAFQQFLFWANAHRPTLAKTLKFHSESWIRKQHQSRVQHKYVYDVTRMENRAEV